MVKKRFQKSKVKYIAAFLSSLIVAFSFLPFYPVYASSQSIGTVDRDVISYSSFNGQLYLGQASHLLAEGSHELLVPVFYKVTGLSNTYSQTYLSGLIDIVKGLNIFGYDSGSPVNVNADYFQPIENDTIRVSWTTSYGLRIYLDNYRNENNSNVDTGLLLGYMHYSYNEVATGYTYTFSVSNVAVTPSNKTVVYGTAYEYGFAESIIYAIDTSTDIEQIITWLSYISQDTSYLPDVVTGLTNINGILGSIYNYMATMNTNQINQMRQLIYALSGVDYSTTSASALSQATYNRWVQLIYDAINYQGPDASAANQEADNLEAAHDQNDIAQDAAYTYMDNALDDIDFAVTVPQGLINSALTIGGYITQIWQNAGSDFQFLVTATLTIGLITVVIGAINRYPKTVTNSETTQETYGVRNGKPYRHISHTSRHTTHHSK